MTVRASAFWVVEPGAGELREEVLPDRGPADVTVRTVCTGISRGTESLVFAGRVPPSEYERMRAPFQAGDFPGPVKYGYLNVGVVEEGPAGYLGRLVFCLYPHQTRYVVPASAVTVLPEDVPAARGVLLGTVETAVNALWDAPPLLGDRITVIGAGMVGCCVARLAAGYPGVRVTLIDVDPGRASVAAALGVDFGLPEDAPGHQDLVFHASGSGAGLGRALDIAGFEAVVVELSWYGSDPVTVGLGGAFHANRLTVRASQVGRIAPPRRESHSFADRRQLAAELLRDNAFDSLISGDSPYADLPQVLADITAGRRNALCHIICYPEESVPCSP